MHTKIEFDVLASEIDAYHTYFAHCRAAGMTSSEAKVVSFLYVEGAQRLARIASKNVEVVYLKKKLLSYQKAVLEL